MNMPRTAILLAALVGITAAAPAGAQSVVPSSEDGSLAGALEDRGLIVVASEPGITGLRSSYHGRKLGSAACRELPELKSSSRVHFGHGGAPSPGGRTARHFDAGAIAYRIENGMLTVALAYGSDPDEWSRSGSFRNDPHGPGDLFLDVRSGTGEVLHFALLNPIDGGRPLGHKGYFEDAQTFRYSGQARPGDLVRLTHDEDIRKSGGRRGFRPGHGPRGLDERVFARGGEPVGGSKLVRYIVDGRQPLVSATAPWHVSEWTIPLGAIGHEAGQKLVVALHAATSCGNDQIAGRIEIAGPDGTGEEPEEASGSIH